MHYRYLTLEQRENLARLIGAGAPQELGRLHAPDYGVCAAAEPTFPTPGCLSFPPRVTAPPASRRAELQLRASATSAGPIS